MLRKYRGIRGFLQTGPARVKGDELSPVPDAVVDVGFEPTKPVTGLTGSEPAALSLSANPPDRNLGADSA